MSILSNTCSCCGCAIEDVGGHRVVPSGIDDVSQLKSVPWVCQLCDYESAACYVCGGQFAPVVSSIVRDDGSILPGIDCCCDTHVLRCDDPMCRDWRIGPDVVPPIICMVYQYEGVVTPAGLDEVLCIPELGLDADFWSQFSRGRNNYLGVPRPFLRHLLERVGSTGKSLARSKLWEMADSVTVAPGFQSWIARINAFVAAESRSSWTVEHHLLASAPADLVRTTDGFTTVNASQFRWANGVAAMPRRVATFGYPEQPLAAFSKRVPLRNMLVVEPLGSPIGFCGPEGGLGLVVEVADNAAFRPDFRPESELDQLVRDTLRSILSRKAIEPGGG